jgi:hypothetical protein
MKNIFRNLILFTIASAFILTASCKKYPDGPLLSLQTKAHRIVGLWDVEYFSINGYDSTSYLKRQPFYGMYSFTNKDHSLYCYYKASDDDYYLYGHWKFAANKKDISIFFNFHSYPEHLGPYRAESATWEIRRLTEKEMWLKTNYSDGREYFLKFKLFKNY